MVSSTVKPFEPLESSLAEDPFTHLQKVFCYFLQGFFAHEKFVGTGMHWVPDHGPDADKTTEMVITSEKPLVESLEKTPHIVVVLGSSQWANISLDQLQALNSSNGQRTHTDLMPSTVSYHCQSKNGNHARRIAWYASWGTNAMRRLIMRQGHLHQINPGHSISAETGPSAYTGPLASEEVASVVVTIPFYWQPGWTIRKPAPILNKMDVHLGLRKIRSANYQGREVRTTPIELHIEVSED